MKDKEAESMQQVHAVLLEMLTDVAALCQRYDLRCCLYCGTLLGAVREGGFIPWDDDADLMMPLEDYRRFFPLAQQELSDKYVVQDLENTPAHPWLWMRVFRKDTTYLRRDWAELPVHHGIALDIYPMIGVADSPAGYRLQRATLDLAKALRHVDYWKVTGYPKERTQARIGRFLGKIPAPLRHRLSLCLMDLAALPPFDRKKCCTLDGAAFVPKFDSADWRETILLPLNGRLFPAPARYDKLLRIMYGEYMTPPPENQRRGHGDEYGGAVIDTERDYTVYQEALARKGAET